MRLKALMQNSNIFKTYIQYYMINIFLLLTKNIKLKDFETPWMSLGMKKSSRQKQKLYKKFLKKKTVESENQRIKKRTNQS